MEKGKSKEVQAASTESVFSGPALPEAFYRSFLKAHSVKAVCLGDDILMLATFEGFYLKFFTMF